MKTSAKEVGTFDYVANDRQRGMADEEIIEVIRRYNDHALFSSDVERPVSMENGHIHFLLKQIASLKKAVKNGG